MEKRFLQLSPKIQSGKGFVAVLVVRTLPKLCLCSGVRAHHLLSDPSGARHCRVLQAALLSPGGGSDTAELIDEHLSLPANYHSRLGCANLLVDRGFAPGSH